MVPAAVARLPEDQRPEVRHQCGERNHETALAAYKAAGVEASVEPFIRDMAEAYGWADLVICRAGALTVSELCAAGVGGNEAADRGRTLAAERERKAQAFRSRGFVQRLEDHACLAGDFARFGVEPAPWAGEWR